jgi:putative ABC transport system permease protein
MKPSKILSIAFENLGQRKLRTSLTTLSVVIGIAAIVGIASLGEGFRIEIKNQLQQGFELNNLTVIPGSLFAGLSRQRFTDAEVKNIQGVLGVQVVTPIMQIGNVTLRNGNKTARAFVAAGVNFTDFIKVFPDRFVYEGAVPQQYGNDTIIIGNKVDHPTANETFAEANDNITLTLEMFLQPLNSSQTIPVLEDFNFTVSGVLQKMPTSGITDFDYWVFLPLDWTRKIFQTEQSDLIFVRVDNAEQSESIANSIEELFPQFSVTILVPATFVRQVDSVLTIVQIFLLAIASISLIVAGIGIMNIMTVSVMERTREIGILKAIGAKSQTVLGMFLSEAILIGLIGGLIGIFTGYGISYALAYALSSFIQPQQQQSTIFQNPERQLITVTPIFSSDWTIVALAFGIAVCIIFGLYPARKASKLNPVEALRYE